MRRTARSTNGGHYFCTFACWGHLPLIHRTGLYDELFAWTHLATAKGCKLTGFVFMPNHVHLLLHVPAGLSVNTVLGNAKRFWAYEVIKRLRSQEDLALLNFLQEGAERLVRSSPQKHRVWDVSSDIKICNNAFLSEQKLRYIHANPMRKGWKLAEREVDYPYSSAAFYANGTIGLAPVVNYREVLKPSL